MAAGRAPDEIRLVCEAALRVADDQLRVLGHQMDRAPAVIDHFLGMSLPEPDIVSRMPGVGAGRCVSAPQRRCHGCIGNRALVAAVADALELAVPCVNRRDPDLELDLRISGRPGGGFDPAERRDRQARARTRGAELAGRHPGSTGHRDIGDCERGKVGAGGACRGARHQANRRGGRNQ